MNALLFVCGLALLVFGAGRLFACTPALGRPSRMLQQVWVPLLVITVACGGVLVQGRPVAPSVLVVPLVPLCCIPAAMLLRRSCPGTPVADAVAPLPLVWPCVGTVLLLVAVAGRLADHVVLVLFTAAVAMLWVASIPRRGEGWGGPGQGWLALALVGAASLAAGMVDLRPEAPAMIGASVALWLCVRLGRMVGFDVALPCAMWTACVSALGLVGVQGLDNVLAMVLGESVPLGVNGGGMVGPLSVVAAPGAALLACCGLLVGDGRWPRGARHLAACGLLLGLIALCWGLWHLG